MVFTRWKQKIADSLIFSTDDGRVLFYPFGPLKGYLLPKPAFQSLIIKSIVWFNISAVASFAVTTAIGVLLNISMDVLLLLGILDYVHYYFRILRITRKLVGLPRRLSIRVYASAQDPVELWERFWSIVFMAIICGVLAFLAPPRALFWVGLTLLCAWVCVLAYIIFLHSRLHCGEGERTTEANQLNEFSDTQVE